MITNEGGEGEEANSGSDNEDRQTIKSSLFVHNNIISKARRGRGRRGDGKGGPAGIVGRGSGTEGQWQ